MNQFSFERRRGMVTVEFAILLPLLLLILFGILEYGWLFLRHQDLSNAARHGARIAILPDMTNADVQAAIDTLMTQANMNGSGYTVSLTPLDVTTADSGDQIDVNMTVPYANIELGLPLIPTPTNLTVRVSMAKEGP